MDGQGEYMHACTEMRSGKEDVFGISSVPSPTCQPGKVNLLPTGHC